MDVTFTVSRITQMMQQTPGGPAGTAGQRPVWVVQLTPGPSGDVAGDLQVRYVADPMLPLGSVVTVRIGGAPVAPPAKTK